MVSHCYGFLRQRPEYASFTSTVRPTVHSNPSRKRSFSKTLFKPENFENAVFVRKRNFSKKCEKIGFNFFLCAV